SDAAVREIDVAERLEQMLRLESGIAGSEFFDSARSTEIRQQNPSNISWFSTTWNWRHVDFTRFEGGVVGAIFRQMKSHEQVLAEMGFRPVAADFYSMPGYAAVEQPVGWYRKYKIKYGILEQSGYHQDPVDSVAEEIVCKRVYVSHTLNGILFSTHRYSKSAGTLSIDLIYSTYAGQLDEFAEYEFQEKLITE
ncbi:MAG: hypothetical protein KDK27_14775, partial [Leptospiraceae bacterium]|nr:hypothetical protein [Leptospiraceae bacterium]